MKISIISLFEIIKKKLYGIFTHAILDTQCYRVFLFHFAFLCVCVAGLASTRLWVVGALSLRATQQPTKSDILFISV